MKKITFITLVFLVSLIACKKNEIIPNSNTSTKSSTSSMIKKMTYIHYNTDSLGSATSIPDTSYHTFEYDSQNRLIKLIWDANDLNKGGYIKYTYPNSTTVVRNAYDGNGVAREIFIYNLNNQGKVISERKFDNDHTKYLYVKKYIYNSTNSLQKIYDSINDKYEEVNAIYSNGNLISKQTYDGLEQYEYYLDKINSFSPIQFGMVERFYLDEYFCSKNLIKKIFSKNEVTNFTYEYDNQGRVVKSVGFKKSNSVNYKDIYYIYY